MIDPVTAVTLGKAISDATGLTDWIAGKFGDSAPVARKVIDIATSVTGAKNPQDVVDILTRDSVKAAELMKAVHDSEMELTRLAFEDLKSARDLQKAALAQDDVFSKRFVYYFITFWSVVTTSYIVAITFGEIPEVSVRYADTILGFLLGTAVAGMFQYLLGSSAGSVKKTQLLSRQASL
jgi:hypothetical protein